MPIVPAIRALIEAKFRDREPRAAMALFCPPGSGMHPWPRAPPPSPPRLDTQALCSSMDALKELCVGGEDRSRLAQPSLSPATLELLATRAAEFRGKTYALDAWGCLAHERALISIRSWAGRRNLFEAYDTRKQEEVAEARAGIREPRDSAHNGATPLAHSAASASAPPAQLGQRCAGGGAAAAAAAGGDHTRRLCRGGGSGELPPPPLLCCRHSAGCGAHRPVEPGYRETLLLCRLCGDRIYAVRVESRSLSFAPPQEEAKGEAPASQKVSSESALCRISFLYDEEVTQALRRATAHNPVGSMLAHQPFGDTVGGYSALLRKHGEKQLRGRCRACLLPLEKAPCLAEHGDTGGVRREHEGVGYLNRVDHVAEQAGGDHYAAHRGDTVSQPPSHRRDQDQEENVQSPKTHRRN